MKHLLRLSTITAVFCSIAASAHSEVQQFAIGGNDSTRIAEIISPLIPATDSTNIITKLTEEDFERVAKELEIEVATIKAVVDIEAGVSHNGFVAPGQALINFDLSVFKSRLKRAGINPAKYKQSHPVVFARPNTRKYGSYGKAQYARLNSALTINEKIALESCFWGMFQIGGFNWKMCGCSSPEDFHNKINQSEAMQLELFANFITSNGLVKHLRNKNWRAFARGYNGASYAKRGYHTRMANSYRKHAQKR